MPWKVKGKCIYKKNTGKLVGCTKGPVKKYLAALHMNAHESKKPLTTVSSATQVKSASLEVAKTQRKTQFQKTFEAFMGTLGGDQINTTAGGDQTGIGEGEYADSDDSSIPATQMIADDTDLTVQSIVDDLKDLIHNHNWIHPVNNDLIQAMCDSLKDIGVEPNELAQAIGQHPEKQEQVISDVISTLRSHVPVDEDESLPASSLAYGTSTADSPDVTTEI